METFDYSKSRRKDLQQARLKKTASVLVGGLLAAGLGYLLGEWPAAALFWLVSALSLNYFLN
jgi:hypothetical protein